MDDRRRAPPSTKPRPFLRIGVRTGVESNAPKGAIRWEPMATPWVNAPERATPCKGTLTFQIHAQVGVLVGRPTRAYCLSRTKPMAWPWAAGSLPLRGEKTPVKMKGWYPAGEALRQHALTVLETMRRARSELSHLGQWCAGRLRVTATATVCRHVSPSVIREFRESFPNWSIKIEPLDTPDGTSALRERRVDICAGLKPDRKRISHSESTPPTNLPSLCALHIPRPIQALQSPDKS